VQAGGEPDSQDTLRRLEERLDRASDLAERLLAEAAAGTGATAARLSGGTDTPPSGWQFRRPPTAEPRASDADADGDADGDAERVVAFVRGLGELVPADMQERLLEALRQLLLAIQAVVDWYLERLEQRHAQGAPVEDIPVL